MRILVVILVIIAIIVGIAIAIVSLLALKATIKFKDSKLKRIVDYFYCEIQDEDVSSNGFWKRDNWRYIPQNIKTMIESGELHSNQIEEIFRLPWKEYDSKIPSKNISLRKVDEILDKTHYGMEKAKLEVKRYLVSLKYSTIRPRVLLLNGPIGTGKTTFAISIAELLGRKYAIVNLNAIMEASDIVGLSSSYRDSTSGAITKAVIRTKVFNPVIILDELDKCAIHYEHGTVWNSLLQLLDRNTNEFTDVFLNINYDITKILFIATSNEITDIPQPLVDRVHVINIQGYSDHDKYEMLKNYILPTMYKQYSRAPRSVALSDDDMFNIISSDKGNQGVRNIALEAEMIYLDKLMLIDTIEA